MRDLKDQLADYLEHAVGRLAVEDLRESRLGTLPVRPGQPPVRRARLPLWVYGLAAAAACLLVLGVGVWLVRSGENVAVQPTTFTNPPTTETTGPPLRRAGEIITYTGDQESGDLVAQDPDSGEVRTLVAAEAGGERIGWAAWSADGRWAAFEFRGCEGIWVMNGLDDPRQLTSPCMEYPEAQNPGYGKLWEWSPTGAQLVVVRELSDGNTLTLIDPATGDRTDLGKAAGEVTSLAWSPDGTRIAYGAVPPTDAGGDYSTAAQGSVYSVSVVGGDHTLLASSLGEISGGEVGSGLRWSPSGDRLAVLTETSPSPTERLTRLYLMDADGSDVDLITEGVVLEHTVGVPGLMWSPDGTQMAYATFSEGTQKLQIWNGMSDGSARVQVFESTPPVNWYGAGPVWSPDGLSIAFRYSPFNGEDASMVANADGTGEARPIDQLRYLSWRGGWYFCECYG